MTDLPERLTQALADRYTIEREVISDIVVKIGFGATREPPGVHW